MRQALPLIVGAMWLLLSAAPVAAQGWLPEGLAEDDTVELDKGAKFFGMTLPEEVTVSDEVAIELFYHLPAELDATYRVFTHVESMDADFPCRAARDVVPERDDENVVVEAKIKLPDTCQPTRLRVVTGVYSSQGGGRLQVMSQATADDRITAGYFDLVESSPNTERQTFSPSDANRWDIWRRLEPWSHWLLGALLALIAALLIRRFTPVESDPEAPEKAGATDDSEKADDDSAKADDDSAKADDDSAKADDDSAKADGDSAKADETDGERESKGDEESEDDGDGSDAQTPASVPPPEVVAAAESPLNKRLSKKWAIGTTALLLGPLLASLFSGLDFIKDDAYISFRYTRNLVEGNGLVFNVGDRLEGFTNFLWTIIMVPFEAMGWDLFQVSEVLGISLAIGMAFTLTGLFSLHHGYQRNLSQLWPGLWLATSSSLALWCTSGMEQPMAMFLPLISVYLMWRARDSETWKMALWSGVLMGLGCMTRPEIHAIGMVAGGALIIDAFQRRTITPWLKAWLVGLLVITVPFHTFRVLYFGELLPNTYYVKTGGSTLVWLAGLEKLGDMFDFNTAGVLLALTPLAFATRERFLEKLVALGIATGFMVFVAKVGADEMRWHRLYLPALPFLCLLAGLGLKNGIDAIVRFVPKGRPWTGYALHAVAWLAVGYATAVNFQFTYKETGGFNGRGDLAGTYHPDVGKFITRHEHPRALVAFQDMGSTPYYAPDIDFLDFIGLVDKRVARARHSYGLHAFMATENYRNQGDYDSEMREYFRERNPEWTILTSYVHATNAQTTAEQFAKDPRHDNLRGRRNNSYQFKIDNDPWFHDNYIHIRTWARSAVYYLSVYRRRDLYDQIPGEIVLDEVPEDLPGPKATFDRNLKLLGAEIEHESKERQEIFVTTWWETPGKFPRDTYFFIHIAKEGYQAAFDHPPGDWLYPGERWREGDVIEDRYLCQLPVNMEPGTYEVYVGVWFRKRGKRLPVTDGPHDGTDRIHLGRLTVTPLASMFENYIEPTVPAEMRKYPDRIVPNGR